ncbi:ATP-grasp domain-containing protein [Ichthyenterobacterium magnum]|uniref:RimK-like ATP-grasp domain-containing protein n=1 Tax=Ichthyenterobacterium magnum TaxID=1230530 RepID=A0A420DKY9_9FLAO|nr:hypothetical protein [Ichthyenterobacterium magnum]RKE94858.1 hypothetical protein BXY80_1871 [Ichthyenterobacterium magnum]
MSKPYDVIILTEHKYVNPKHIDTYTKNVLYEDQLVQNALNNLGLKTLRLAWDDTTFDWSTTKAVLFRATWDYFHRFNEFSQWLSRVTTQTQLLNSKDLILWNIDKHYLNDLENNGVHIAESLFIEQNSTTTLKTLHQTLGWKDTVLKPCISGAARHTYKLNLDNLEVHEAVFKSLIKDEAMMLQPFQHSIVTKGEVSMMVFNGIFTHAILKKAKAGDFRVQDDFGGSVHDYKPTQEEISFAENSVKACPELPIYARVDIFEDNNSKIAVSELELIEPELWFRHFPEAANVLAKAIKEKMTHEN